MFSAGHSTSGGRPVPIEVSRSGVLTVHPASAAGLKSASAVSGRTEEGAREARLSRADKRFGSSGNPRVCEQYYRAAVGHPTRVGRKIPSAGATAEPIPAASSSGIMVPSTSLIGTLRKQESDSAGWFPGLLHSLFACCNRPIRPGGRAASVLSRGHREPVRRHWWQPASQGRTRGQDRLPK